MKLLGKECFPIVIFKRAKYVLEPIEESTFSF